LQLGIQYTTVAENAIEDDSGYQYTFHRTNKNGDDMWRCRKRVQKSCKGNIRTRGNRIIGLYNQHNHSSETSYLH
jgi:hypothetical protein